MRDDPQQPSFKNPPLVEVAISIQFNPIPNFHVGFIGLLWGKYKDRYPLVEHKDPVVHSVEKTGLVNRATNAPPTVHFSSEPTIPRIMFMDQDQGNFVQFQKDRLIVNWRKHSEDSKYPRYSTMRLSISHEYALFKKFLEEHDLAEVQVDQLETTYVNHIEVGNRSIEEVFPHLLRDDLFNKNIELETFKLNYTHIIKSGENFVGRLYTSIEKARRTQDGVEIFVLRFVGRCHPVGNQSDGVFSALDLIRENVNSSFKSITSTKMHEFWKEDST
ncbi:MAG: TIGR04255 family protein [Pseudomonadales bacterium]|nr:TIGR04255 family protein [Pseudomonadales bacterium]